MRLIPFTCSQEYFSSGQMVLFEPPTFILLVRLFASSAEVKVLRCPCCEC